MRPGNILRVCQHKPGSFTITTMCCKGLLRELNPGPLAPEARIMPLDQAALMQPPKIGLSGSGIYETSVAHLRMSNGCVQMEYLRVQTCQTMAGGWRDVPPHAWNAWLVCAPVHEAGSHSSGMQV